MNCSFQLFVLQKSWNMFRLGGEDSEVKYHLVNMLHIAPGYHLRLSFAAAGSNPKHTFYAFFNLYY